MKKLSILLIGVLLFSTVAVNSVKALDLTITNLSTSEGVTGYFIGQPTDFGFTIVNSSSGSLTDKLHVKVYHSVSGLPYFTDDIEFTIAGDSEKNYNFSSNPIMHAGDIIIKAWLDSGDTKQITVTFYDFSMFLTINKTSLYIGDELVMTGQVTNRGISETFKVDIFLMSPGGGTVTSLIAGNTSTVNTDDTYEISLNYIFDPEDAEQFGYGQYTVTCKVYPVANPSLKKDMDKTTILKSPDVSVTFNVQQFYEIGKIMKFDFTLYNNSDTSVIVDNVFLEIKQEGESKLGHGVILRINNHSSSGYEYSIPLDAKGLPFNKKKFNVEVELDADKINENTGNMYWKEASLTINIYLTILGMERKLVQCDTVPMLTMKKGNFDIHIVAGKEIILYPSIQQRVQQTVTLSIINQGEADSLDDIFIRLIDPNGLNMGTTPSKLQALHFSAWYDQGNARTENITFLPAYSESGNVIEGTYTLQFYVGNPAEGIKLVPDLTFTITSRPYSRELTIAPILQKDAYVQGETLTLDVTIINTGVEFELYTLFLSMPNRIDGKTLTKTRKGQVGTSPSDNTATESFSIGTGEFNIGNTSISLQLDSSAETPEIDPLPVRITAPLGLATTPPNIFSMEISHHKPKENTEVEVIVWITNNEDAARDFTVRLSVPSGVLIESAETIPKTIFGKDDPDRNRQDFKFVIKPQQIGQYIIRAYVNDQVVENLRGVIDVQTSTTGEIPSEGMGTNTKIALLAIAAIGVLWWYTQRKEKPKEAKVAT